jgi:phage baseplate assembly protein W
MPVRRSTVQKPSWFGRGLKFPFSINPDTGSTVVTEGSTDAVSVGIQYLQDYLLTSDLTALNTNHVAESIAHILLTTPLEHDTLPPFGSKLDFLLFAPNDIYTRQEFETWVEQSTIRWEKRARVPVPDGIVYDASGLEIDRGELNAQLIIDFLKTQDPTNLVAPFVTPRQARNQEYPISETGNDKVHDYVSRYLDGEQYTIGTESYTRLKKTGIFAPADDDIFYEVKNKDTWLLVSWKNYQDIRLWYFCALYYLEDIAENGSQADIDTTGDPQVGDLLRLPSRSRIFMQLT